VGLRLDIQQQVAATELPREIDDGAYAPHGASTRVCRGWRGDITRSVPPAQEFPELLWITLQPAALSLPLPHRAPAKFCLGQHL
jgi:hypothetical protein